MERFDQKNRELMLASYGFLRVPILESGTTLTPGIVVVTDNHSNAKLLEQNLKRADWARRHDDAEIPPENFHIGTCLNKRIEYEEDVFNFLDTEEFLPVLIASGMAPDFLDDSYIVMRMNSCISEETITEVKELKKWVIANIDYVINEIKTLGLMVLNSECKSMQNPMMIVIYIIGGIWRQFFRSKLLDEEYAEDWLFKFIEWGYKLQEERENLTGVYQISEAVNHCVFRYIEDGNEVQVISLDEVEEFLEGNIEDYMIFYDDETYYIQEKMLNKMCASLTEAVTFHQIKVELQSEGTLICNDLNKRNFTVKKVITMGDKVNRKRFLAFKKEAFESENGQYLEEVFEMLKNNQEVLEDEIGNF